MDVTCRDPVVGTGDRRVESVWSDGAQEAARWGEPGAHGKSRLRSLDFIRVLEEPARAGKGRLGPASEKGPLSVGPEPGRLRLEEQ